MPSGGRAMSPAPAQYLLTHERQLCMDGRLEPLVDTSAAPTPPPPPSRDRSKFLRLEAKSPQLPLPLPTKHQLRDGGGGKAKPAHECVRGWTSTQCPPHPELERMVPLLCCVQPCESSRVANSRKRARDVWDGTSKSKAPVGMRHLLRDGVALGVFVWTLPSELRRLCQGKLLLRYREQAWLMTLEVLERHGGGPGLQVWAREYLHPVGEPGIPRPGEPEPEAAPVDGTDYKPHSNVLVPLCGLTARGTLWRGKPRIPFAWMGTDGWVMARWRERLVSVFGQWWQDGAEVPDAVWFYEPRELVEEQRHALRYFARVFPAWAKHSAASVRPSPRGLSNGRKAEDLAVLLDALDRKCGPERSIFATCKHSTPDAPCPPPVRLGSATEDGLRAALLRCFPVLATVAGVSTSILNNGESCGRACGPWPTAPPAFVETGPPVTSLPVLNGLIEHPPHPLPCIR